MAEIVYHVAVSLDGYIATSDGGVAWLSAFEAEGSDYGYSEFYASIDALVMGSHTYEQVLTFGDWVYPGKPCWVLSQRPIEAKQPEVKITAGNPAEIVTELQIQQLKRVWLVGGGKLAASFRSHGLISEYIIAVIPTILGAGISLFASPGEQEQLQLAECKPFASGLVLLRYLRAKEKC